MRYIISLPAYGDLQAIALHQIVGGNIRELEGDRVSSIKKQYNVPGRQRLQESLATPPVASNRLLLHSC